MNKKLKNSLIGSGIVATTLGILGTTSYFITKRLVKMAMDRTPSKYITNKRSKIMGHKRLCEFAEELSVNSRALENCYTKQVEITAHDKIKLVGHWYTCEKPRRIIIAMHGWRSSWSNDFGCIADFWHNNNCNVLFAEQRAHHGSGGDYMSFGLLERYDCLQWVNWVNKTMDKTLPVYLGGVSMGASTVLMATGLDLPENVKGVVADSGFTSPDAIWKHVMNKNLHMSYRIRGAVVDDMCRKKINMGSKAYSTLEAMKKCKIPVLFVHGTDDHFVPVEMTYENYKACGTHKKLLIVPGADHCMNYYMNKDAYEKALKEFWHECEG